MSMHLLVTSGSKRGGTEGIAAVVAEALRMRGYEVTEQPAAKAPPPDDFDAVIVGGGSRYVSRHAKSLRKRPLWLFSTTAFDDSVAILMERTGAIAHATFGEHDWDRVRAWANDIADHLFTASPGRAREPPGGRLPRLVEHALVGGLACAAAFASILVLASPRAAFELQAVLAPATFTLIANHYFAAWGAREPFSTGLVFAAMTAAFELAVIAGLSEPGVATSWIGFYVPLFAIFVVTWAIGAYHRLHDRLPRNGYARREFRARAP